MSARILIGITVLAVSWAAWADELDPAAMPSHRFAPQSVYFHSRTAGAVAQAQRLDRPVLVLVTVEGDEEGRQMLAAALRHPTVSPAISKFVCINVHPSHPLIDTGGLSNLTGSVNFYDPVTRTRIAEPLWGQWDGPTLAARLKDVAAIYARRVEARRVAAQPDPAVKDPRAEFAAETEQPDEATGPAQPLSPTVLERMNVRAEGPPNAVPYLAASEGYSRTWGAVGTSGAWHLPPGAGGVTGTLASLGVRSPSAQVLSPAAYVPFFTTRGFRSPGRVSYHGYWPYWSWYRRPRRSDSERRDTQTVRIIRTDPLTEARAKRLRSEIPGTPEFRRAQFFRSLERQRARRKQSMSELSAARRRLRDLESRDPRGPSFVRLRGAGMDEAVRFGQTPRPDPARRARGRQPADAPARELTPGTPDYVEKMNRIRQQADAADAASTRVMDDLDRYDFFRRRAYILAEPKSPTMTHEQAGLVFPWRQGARDELLQSTLDARDDVGRRLGTDLERFGVPRSPRGELEVERRDADPIHPSPEELARRIERAREELLRAMEARALREDRARAADPAAAVLPTPSDPTAESYDDPDRPAPDWRRD